MPVEGMVDPGSSATIISFALLQEIGKQAQIPSEALKLPDIVLRDYSQNPISVGAQVSLVFRWQDRTVTTPVYVRSDIAPGAESCLLGTNVVVPLGLMIPGEGVEARGGPIPVASPNSGAAVQASVSLVGVWRIPSHCAAVVTVEAQGCLAEGVPGLFEPNPDWLSTTGLEVE